MKSKAEIENKFMTTHTTPEGKTMTANMATLQKDAVEFAKTHKDELAARLKQNAEGAKKSEKEVVERFFEDQGYFFGDSINVAAVVAAAK